MERIITKKEKENFALSLKDHQKAKIDNEHSVLDMAIY